MKRLMRWMALALSLLLATVGMSMAEQRQPGGKGEGARAVLEQGIAWLEGDDPDYEKAMQCFVEATEAGDRKAPRYVGLMFERGLGVEADEEAAAEYYAMGVERRDLTSAYYLALLYEQGRGVEQDYEKAVELLESLAASGNKSATGVLEAEYELAALYERGIGVAQDLERAVSLYSDAAQYGNEAAAEALERLNENLNPPAMQG